MDTMTATPAVTRRPRVLEFAMARGFALFLGGFSLLNLLGELRVRHFDANLWWIDLRPAPPPLAHLFLFLVALGLLAWGSGLRLPRRARGAVFALVAAGSGVVLGNALTFYLLLAHGIIRPGIPLPLSALLLCGLLLVLRTVARGEVVLPQWRLRAGVALALLVYLLAFPLAQIFLFGSTDYRRPAEAIVVFGARAYADGSPSDALADRMRTACRLYHQGLAPVLICSGGPGDGDIHEPEAMRRLAVSLGVPDAAILLDPAGVDTQATVRNTAALLRAHDLRRVIAVSHAFHLPRIKLAYQRAGWEVYTVPVADPRLRATVPYLICREVVALWAYYLRPLWE